MLVEWRLGDFGADSAFFADDERVVVLASPVSRSTSSSSSRESVSDAR